MTEPDDLATAFEDDDPIALTGELADAPEPGPLLVDIKHKFKDEPLEAVPLRWALSEPLGASYRLCLAGTELRDEINRQYPQRDKSSDGWIGDTAHAARKSDHNPNSAGVVRAIDVDKDGLPAGSMVEHLRKMGKSGDRRLRGGYLIFNSRIAGTHTAWDWHAYKGSNPHDKHFHVSFADAASDYEASGAWGIVPVKKADRWLGLFNPPLTGADVKQVQQAVAKSGIKVAIDGVYGRQTADAVHVMQTRAEIRERGVGPLTWAHVRRLLRGR